MVNFLKLQLQVWIRSLKPIQVDICTKHFQSKFRFVPELVEPRALKRFLKNICRYRR